MTKLYATRRRHPHVSMTRVPVYTVLPFFALPTASNRFAVRRRPGR